MTKNMPGVAAYPAIPLPAYVIMMEPSVNCAPLRRRLRYLVPELSCIQATRTADIRSAENGTARLITGTTIRYHHPFVHPDVFAVHKLELAILLSHLRAIGACTASGADACMILEEDAEWSLLLSAPHDTLLSTLAALPRHWTTLQAAVIAELPHLRHLHRRLRDHQQQQQQQGHAHASKSASLGHAQGAHAPAGQAPGYHHVPAIVPRATLRGLSWPFTPGRAVVESAVWLRPYWSAAAYAVSGRGARGLLSHYWPSWPRLDETTLIDTTSQLWPAADQLVFNQSGAYLTTPMITQPITGSHAEHLAYKKVARDFFLRQWRPRWQSLADKSASSDLLTDVPIALFTVGANGSSAADGGALDVRCLEALASIASRSWPPGSTTARHHARKHHHQSLTARFDGAGRDREVARGSQPMVAGLPAHVQVLGATIESAIHVHIHIHIYTYIYIYIYIYRCSVRRSRKRQGMH